MKIWYVVGVQFNIYRYYVYVYIIFKICRCFDFCLLVFVQIIVIKLFICIMYCFIIRFVGFVFGEDYVIFIEREEYEWSFIIYFVWIEEDQEDFM